MEERISKILFAVAVVVGAVSWIGIGFSTLCIVNGGRWGMVIPLVVSVFGVLFAGQLSDWADDRKGL